MDADPLFPVAGGFFAPVALPRGPLAVRVEHAVRAIDAPAGVSIYVRGGVAERVVPHPRADIDIVVVGPSEGRWLDVALQQALHDEGRPIEVTYLTPERLRVDLVHQVLLSTRALRLSGPPVALRPVRATDAIVWAFWERYAAFLVTPRPGTPALRRVCELKQLTRCYGAVRWFVDGSFTRDVSASLAFADAWAPRAAALLRMGWAEVDAAGSSLSDATSERGLDSPVGPLDADAVRAPLVPFVRDMRARGRR